MTISSTSRVGTLTLLLAAAVVLLIGVRPDRAEAAPFEPGKVIVTGYNWSVDEPRVEVQLPDTDDKAYTVLEILQQANAGTDQFQWATIPGIEIILPGSLQKVTCTGDQVRAQNGQCPTFRFTVEETVMRTRSGQTVPYTNSIPEIYIPKSEDISVSISPRSRKIKSGQTVNFTATVQNAIGNVTYSWDFGDGRSTNTSNGQVSHTFTGEDETFSVVVTVKGSASPRTDTDVALVTIGKTPKPRKPRPPKKQNEAGGGDPTGGSSGYPPGYGDYGGYGGPPAPGYGTPSPGPSSPAPPPPEQPPEEPDQVPADDGLETVSGQLIDPAMIGSIAPPDDGPAGGGGTVEQATEEADGGGGISDGALTAIGIGALLGLGGLAEAAGFAGFRRFRLRP